ncbi:PUS7 [Symbiodinium pilosum]|uniref:peptidyl-tRNA hydrolase n=1 Tax=Symbiodinium pilosum TaxID=2952 RepID=A0A812UMI2_SYMPI|nr:PUS7 [Symbiodinium pilosum]
MECISGAEGGAWRGRPARAAWSGCRVQCLKHGPSFVSTGFLQKQKPTATPSEAGQKVDFDADGINDGSKEARKKAHQIILKHLGSFINTETVESDGSRSIRVWMREAERKAKAPAATSDSSHGKGAKKGKGKGGKGKGKNSKGKNNKSEGQTSVETQSSFGTMRREGWPKDRPDYLYFRLHKENCDTGEAVSSIARCVGRSAKQFTIAGTKDRRAITVQQICAHRLPMDQLRRSVLHRLWDKRVRISDLEYRKERLRLGQLRGNRFKVVLQKVPLNDLKASTSEGCSEDSQSSSHVSSAMTTARQGFLNYYGLQRFGTRQVRTHTVGAAIIAGEWQKAVRLILGEAEGKPFEVAGTLGKRAGEEVSSPPSKRRCLDSEEDKAEKDESMGGENAEGAQRHEKEDTQKVKGKGAGKGKQGAVLQAQRLFLEDGDAQRALEVMRRGQHLERCLLGALARGLSFVDALSQLPHQAVSLYAHAAQSLLWNAVLSRRIHDFGRAPRAGDLVLLNSDGCKGSCLDAPTELDNEESLFDDAGGQECEEVADLREDGGQETHSLPSVRALACEDAQAAQFTDVVLPLPGSDVVYPEYLQKVYEDLSMSLLGLSLNDFASSKLVPLKGSYRHAAVCPESLEWRIVLPEELQSTAALIDSDVAKLMRNRPVNVELSEGGSMAGVPKEASDQCTAGTGAVLFSCVLPPSSYLREAQRDDVLEGGHEANNRPISGIHHNLLAYLESRKRLRRRTSLWETKRADVQEMLLHNYRRAMQKELAAGLSSVRQIVREELDREPDGESEADGESEDGEESEEWKLIICVRHDLNMSIGKVAAQVGHAVHHSVTHSRWRDLKDWEESGSKKVTLKTESEAELQELLQKARSQGLLAETIQDAGHTEVEPGTTTVLAIGPAPARRLDTVTGHLKPLPDRAQQMEKQHKKLLERAERLQKELDEERRKQKKVMKQLTAFRQYL